MSNYLSIFYRKGDKIVRRKFHIHHAQLTLIKKANNKIFNLTAYKLKKLAEICGNGKTSESN